MSKYVLPEGIPFTVKNIKTFTGNEGLGYEATIYFNGRKVGTVLDDAWGGPLQFHGWKQEDREALKAYAKSLPGYPPDDLFKEGMPMTDDLLIEELVNAALDVRDLKRLQTKYQKLCQTQFIFRLKGSEKGALMVVGSKAKPLSADGITRARAAMVAKYGDQIEFILNDVIDTDPGVLMR